MTEVVYKGNSGLARLRNLFKVTQLVGCGPEPKQSGSLACASHQSTLLPSTHLVSANTHSCTHSTQNYPRSHATHTKCNFDSLCTHTHTHTRMSGCQWYLWLASRTGRGSPREGRALWPQPASPEMPSLHFPAAPLTLPLVLFLPGRQVQCREPTALDKVPRESVGHEDVVLGHDGDACVVTDDAGQGDPGQGLLLLLAEHAIVLPPEPARNHPRPLCLRPSWAGWTPTGWSCCWVTEDHRGQRLHGTGELQALGQPGAGWGGIKTNRAPLTDARVPPQTCSHPSSLQASLMTDWPTPP